MPKPQTKEEAFIRMANAFDVKLSTERLLLYCEFTDKYQEKMIIDACDTIIYNEEKFPTISKLLDVVIESISNAPPEEMEYTPPTDLTPEELRIKNIVEMYQDDSTPEEFVEEIKEEEEQSGTWYWEGVLTEEQVELAKQKGWLL